MFAVICGCSCKVLLCLRPPVRAVRPNHEVAVFQPWTGTAPNLGSVANCNFYSNPPAPPVSTGFLDIFIYPLYPTAPPSVSFVLVFHLSCTLSPPHLPEQISVHLDVTHHPAIRHLPPAILCLSSLLPAPCAYFCIMSCDRALPPLLTSACSQVPVRTWGVL